MEELYMNGKIVMLKAYQGVTFEGTTHTFFVDKAFAKKDAYSRMPSVELSATEHGVLVLGEKSAVLVGWANIGSLEYDRASLDIKSEDKKSKAK
jgi:hypothetical protein